MRRRSESRTSNPAERHPIFSANKLSHVSGVNHNLLPKLPLPITKSSLIASTLDRGSDSRIERCDTVRARGFAETTHAQSFSNTSTSFHHPRPIIGPCQLVLM
jgi:hypothetical protein